MCDAGLAKISCGNFIKSKTTMYLHKNIIVWYSVIIVVMLYFKILLLLLSWNRNRDRFIGMVKFIGGLRCNYRN